MRSSAASRPREESRRADVKIGSRAGRGGSSANARKPVEAPAKAGTQKAPAKASTPDRSAAETAPSAARKTSPQRALLEPKADAAELNLGYLSGFLGFHLRLAQDASYRAFSRHRDKEIIKPGRYPALAIISLNPGISQSALGRAIARDKSTVSPLIKDLQSNGFISRKPSPYDRRSVTLALTKKGERILERLHIRAKEHEDEMDVLVGQSKAKLMSMLSKIITGLSAS